LSLAKVASGMGSLDTTVLEMMDAVVSALAAKNNTSSSHHNN
jgi:hypothetical protein